MDARVELPLRRLRALHLVRVLSELRRLDLQSRPRLPHVERAAYSPRTAFAMMLRWISFEPA